MTISQRNENSKILNAENITKDFNGRTIIENVSMDLYRKEIVCLLGISGIGKSTLLNVLSGLLHPDSGSVFINDLEITGQPGHVSYMLQKDLLLPFKTIIDNVSLPLVIRGVKRSEARKKAGELFDLFGLAGCEKKYPAQLSGGMRQRAALLRTYLFSKDVVLLDEPFSALDAITKDNMHKWYLDIAEQLDLSTIFITHDINEAITLSDRIYIMTGAPGKITAEVNINVVKPRSPEFLTSDKFMEYKREILKYIF